MDFVQTRQWPEIKMFINNKENVLKYREIGDKFGVGSSTDCKKVNTASTDENLFGLVHGDQICARHQHKAIFRLVSVPGHQI